MLVEWVQYSGKRANEKKTTNLASSQGRKKGVKKRKKACQKLEQDKTKCNKSLEFGGKFKGKFELA